MNAPIIYSVKFEKGRYRWGLSYLKDSVVSLGHPEVINSLAKGYRYYINKFVPKKKGYLRRSARAKYKVNAASEGGNGTGSATIYWGETARTSKYAHYQFVGEVYGPNKAVFNKKGKHIGWRSPKGENEKYATGRFMGVPFTYELHDGRVVYVKGYTTKGTGYDWITRFAEDDGHNGETAVNIRAGRYLYEAAMIKSHQKPRGGIQVYRKWNQIKNRTG